MKNDFKKLVKRELEVAFSTKTQSLWVRLVKYILLAVLIYFFGGDRAFWMVFAATCFLALLLHFWARYKTNGWTKSYGLWKHDAPDANAE